MLQKTLETLRSGFITILFILSSDSYALDFIPIKKGETSTISGFVISVEDEKRLREINERFKLSQEKTVKLQDLQVNQELTIKQYEIHTDRLQSSLNREQWIGSLKGVGGFLLGVLATSIAIQVAKKNL